MCYIKYQRINIFHFEKLLMLMKSIMLTIRGCDTSRYLGIQFSLFVNSVRDTKYRERCIDDTMLQHSLAVQINVHDSK